MTHAHLENLYARWCRPHGSVITVAGAIRADEARACIEATTCAWEGDVPLISTGDRGPGDMVMLDRDTAQAHVAMTWPAPAIDDPDELHERIASAVLGGTSSGRLFTEIRQRRSLCYAVQSHYSATALEGWCTLSAGTMPDHTSALIDACREQVRTMAQGISMAEFERARRALRTGLILRDESTSARAARLAVSVVDRGRCLTQQEHLARIDGVTLEGVNAWCRRYADVEPAVVVAAPKGTSWT